MLDLDGGEKQALLHIQVCFAEALLEVFSSIIDTLDILCMTLYIYAYLALPSYGKLTNFLYYVKPHYHSNTNGGR